MCHCDCDEGRTRFLGMRWGWLFSTLGTALLYGCSSGGGGSGGPEESGESSSSLEVSPSLTLEIVLVRRGKLT